MNPPSAPTVQIPADLFQAMAACFYGGGPDHWELRGKPRPASRPGRQPAEQLMQPPDAVENGDDGGDLLRRPGSGIPLPSVMEGLFHRPGYEPQGVARPKTQPAPEGAKPS